jgi:hypothetical protein
LLDGKIVLGVDRRFTLSCPTFALKVAVCFRRGRLLSPVLSHLKPHGQEIFHLNPCPKLLSRLSGQAATSAAYSDFAEVRPSDLSLLPLEHVRAQERLCSPGTQIGNDAAQLNHTARIAVVANHTVDARGTKLRILFQSLADEGQVRIRQATAQRLGAVGPTPSATPARPART